MRGRLLPGASASASVVFALLLGAIGCGGEKGAPGRPSAATSPVPADASTPAIDASDVPNRTPRAPGSPPAVIWLGMDGLDWEILDRLSAAGKMPNWQRLVATGYSSRITSFMPILSPVVWTTVATGIAPDVHRILDFQEVDPKTGQKVPISGRSRRVPAIWNLASAAGKKVGIVGWWATHPAEEVNGFFISDHASPILYEKLPLSGVAFPSSLESGVGQAVARESRVSAAELARFVDVSPAEIEQALGSGKGMENPIVALSRILGATRVYQRAARDLYDRNHPDLLMLYVEGTDSIGHVFAPDAPPRLACTPDEDVRRYGRAADEYYSLVDRLLGQWMRRAQEDGATLLVSSDHGFKWAADRPCERSSLDWSTAPYWHRMEGVFAAWGARVRPGRATSKPTMFDPAPTVLALLGIAPDRRMTGRPVAGAFDGLKALPAADVFERIQVRRVAAEELNPAQANEYAKKLLALGYLTGSETRPLAAPGGAEPGMTEGAWNNLGLYERETVKDLRAARAAFEKALALRPDYHSPMFNLAVLARMEGKDREAEDWLFRSLKTGHADPPGTVRQWIAEYRRLGRTASARSIEERALKELPGDESLALEIALDRFHSRDCAGASEALAKFENATRETKTLNALGLFDVCLGKREEATRLFERSLGLDSNQPGVVESLRVIHGGAPKQ
ncbi:MAG TPA: alkaline phosphatase family protein [Thermoanaerobaculia bacterium]|nr:alkaline phosphatase family protein [Thermoanaerobaculia bacterium]